MICKHGLFLPSQLSRQSVRLLTDWSQVRALSTALLGPQLSQVERSAHNRDVMGSNPIGPIVRSYVLIVLQLRWCSPANHFGLSSRRLGFESRSEHFLYLKDIWESPSLSLQRGCPSGQRRQAQDLLTQVYQGSNPCSRIFFNFFSFYSYYGIHLPGQGRRSSYGTVDPVTRVQISAPAPFLNFFYYFNSFQIIFYFIFFILFHQFHFHITFQML